MWKKQMENLDYRSSAVHRQADKSARAIKTQKNIRGKPCTYRRHGSATSLEKDRTKVMRPPLVQRPTAQIIVRRNDEQVFQLAFKFVKKILGSKEELSRVINLMGFVQKKMEQPVKQIVFEAEHTPVQRRKVMKKVSINGLPSDSSSDDEFESPFPSILFESSYRLSLRVVKLIYENPSPFLIVYSLCLLLKYLWRTEAELRAENVVKLLAVSTIISYKLNYDQEISGIASHYGSLMDAQSSSVNEMEATFLNGLYFETYVDKMQYYLLSQIVMNPLYKKW